MQHRESSFASTLSVYACALLLQVFTTRSLAQMAANAEAVKQQVEDFKSVVPLVQVGCKGELTSQVVNCHSMLSL